MKIFIKEIQPFKLVYKTYIGEPQNIKRLEKLWKEILEWGEDKGIIKNMRSAGIYGVGVSYGRYIFKNPGMWKYETGIISDIESLEEDYIKIKEIYGGNYLSTRHLGLSLIHI